MTRLPALAALVMGAMALPMAHAADGALHSFTASATKVKVGSKVDFQADFGMTTDAWRSGGSNPTEPEPVDGWQEWYVNWYSVYEETLLEVQLQAADQWFSSTPNAAPGASHADSWSFAVTFDDVGLHEVTLSGSWSYSVVISEGSEVADRYCSYDDYDNPVSLSCSWWNWSYPQYDDSYTDTFALGPRSITIEVVAVPEPATLALWAAGLGLLGGLARRQRAG